MAMNSGDILTSTSSAVSTASVEELLFEDKLSDNTSGSEGGSADSEWQKYISECVLYVMRLVVVFGRIFSSFAIPEYSFSVKTRKSVVVESLDAIEFCTF
jgi:hypothetical protein